MYKSNCNILNYSTSMSLKLLFHFEIIHGIYMKSFLFSNFLYEIFHTFADCAFCTEENYFLCGSI